MSDLPERIWVSHDWRIWATPDTWTGDSRGKLVAFVRADLSAPVAVAVPSHGPVFVTINDIMQRADDAIFEMDKERKFDDLRREMQNWVSEAKLALLNDGRGGV